MRKAVLAVCFLFAVQFTPGAQTATPSALKNEDVIKMVKAGLAQTIILATIRSQATDFDISPQALITLKESGVSETIITAMVDKFSAPSEGNVPFGEVILRDGTEIKLRLVKTISSAIARVEEPVDFEVIEDVAVDGVSVIQKGAVAGGKVIEARKKKSFGRRGILNFTIDFVRAVDGQNIRLRTTKDVKGDESYGKAGVVTILAGPFGALVKGKDVEVVAGTEYTIYIDGDRNIKLNR